MQRVLEDMNPNPTPPTVPNGYKLMKMSDEIKEGDLVAQFDERRWRGPITSHQAESFKELFSEIGERSQSWVCRKIGS